MRKILAVTGIRSDYDLMVPVFSKIQSHKDLELEIVVCGAHLSKQFGYTVETIEKDGFFIAEKIESLINGDSKVSRLKGAALQLTGLIQTVARVSPDLLLVLGDREEAITCAMVATYLDIPLAHVSGGDKVEGNVDDSIRHAVSKLAHLHFPTNSESEERILKLGEEKFRVFNTGNPGIDRFKETEYINDNKLFSFLGFSAEKMKSTPLLVVLQHVLSSEAEHSYEQMKETLECIKKLSLPTVIISPNSDAGTKGIFDCIDEYKKYDFIKVFKNIPRLEFVNTLRRASCILGNSSLGLLEAPFLKLPAINIGNRQKGRLHGRNMIFVPHNRNEIYNAVNTALYDEKFKLELENSRSPYGDGDSSQKIVDILASVKIDKALLVKKLTYD